MAFDPVQLGLWEPPPERLGGFRPLPMPLADARYDPCFIGPVEARALFEALMLQEPWHQSRRKMWDREVDVPRLQTWYGDDEQPLDFPDGRVQPRAWSPVLLELRERVSAACGEDFNAVLLNLYRDGRDSVAWHSDYEGRQGGRVVIASLTLGAVRRFMFRPKAGREGSVLAFDLPSGSLLVMGDGVQEHWEHHVPKTARPVGPRINLTFRRVRKAG
jgi:alkylated DNA repair dioxygenase AlkB